VPRCKKQRCCRGFKNDIIYKPRAIPLKELLIINIELDEFEAMRLCDLESHDQESAGRRMGVSRGTIQRLVDSGRKKLVGAIVSCAAIRIATCPISKKSKQKE